MIEQVEMRSVRTPGIWSPATRGFLLLWMGEVVSLIGSGMTCFAQSVHVYTNMEGTIMNLTLLAVLAQIPGILISPLAGLLVDRWDRRLVMVVGNTVAAVATLTLRILIVSSSFQIWHLYVIVVVISLANHFQWPAYFSTVRLMVPRDRLGYANGLVQMGRSIGTIAAPVMAGIAVTQFELEGVILFDMLTYVFALAMILVVRIPKVTAVQSATDDGFSFWKETFGGWKYLLDRPELSALLVFFSFATFTYAAGGILIIPLGLSISNATVLGGTLAAGGLSMVVGGLVMGIWGGPKRRIYGILGFVAVQAVALIVMGIKPYLPLILIGYLLYSFTEPIVNACSGTIWHRKIPLDVQGRVLAASGMVSSAALQLGYLFSAVLADNVFVPALSAGGSLAPSLGAIIGVGKSSAFCLVLLMIGFLCLMATMIGFFHTPLRLLEDRLPDATEEPV